MHGRDVVATVEVVVHEYLPVAVQVVATPGDETQPIPLDALGQRLQNRLQLDLESYGTELHERMSLQLCRAGAGGQGGPGQDFAERVGPGAVYAFVYPNLMLNRYGPILDTNWVVPLGPSRTLTVFDYFFEEESADEEFVTRSLAASDRVQQEDIRICESVQRGLASSAYDRGRYAPGVEGAAHRFHCLLSEQLRSA